MKFSKSTYHSVLLILIVLVSLISSFTSAKVVSERKKIERPELSFGVIADVQYCECDQEESRYYRNSLKKLAECIQELNSQELDFVILLGDLIDRDFASYQKVLPIYQQLEMPKYYVLGNHDFFVKTEEKSKVLEALSLESRYYSFTYQSWRFVVLDSNDLSFYATAEGSERRKEAESTYAKLKESGVPNAVSWNGGLSIRQMMWLREILEKADKKGERVIIFSHFPVLPESDLNLWNDRDLIELIESYKCVVAFMNGHNHLGDYQVRNGIHYLTFQAMVETQNHNSYAILEAYSDHLEIVGYGRETSRKLIFAK